jgi:hypothetical protein
MFITKIRSKLLRLMEVKVADQSKVFWSLLLAFINGGLLCYISSFPIALFLTHYSSEQLPQIYLIVAGLSVCVGFIYTFFEYRVSFNTLAMSLTALIGIVLALLGLALVSISANWVILILLVWAILAYDLLDFSVWSVINRIYTIQQAKKSFGIIRGFQGAGGLIAGLASPLFIAFIGLKNLIICTGAAIILLPLITFMLIKTVGFVEEDVSEESESENLISIKSIVRNHYILKIFAFITLGIFFMYIVDILFNTAVEEHYPSEERLAGFLGVFFGLVDVLDLLCSVLLFGWLLKRVGLVFTLLAPPMLGMLVTIPIVLFSGVPVLVYLVFWLIISLKLIEEGLRASLSEMGGLLLLQPFPLKLRSFLQSKIDSIIVGFATALISILLIVITSVFGVSKELLSVLGLICLGLIITVLFSVKQEYIKALSKAISSRCFDRGQVLSLTKEDLHLLKSYLSSPYPDEVIYALSSIEQIDKAAFANALEEALKLKNIAVDLFLISKIKEHRLMTYYPVLISFLEKSGDELVRVNALKCAAFLDYDQVQLIALQQMSKGSDDLSATALITVLHHEKQSAHLSKALELLHAMSNSTSESARSQSAYILGCISQEGLMTLLKTLSEDTYDGVKDRAFHSILKAHQRSLYEILIKNITLSSINTEFLDDFKEEINYLLPLIEEHFNSLSYEAKARLLNILSQTVCTESRALIERCILDDDLPIKDIALKVLQEFDSPCEGDFLKALNQQILNEAHYLRRQHESIEVTPNLEYTTLLLNILERKKQLSLERLMRSLCLYYHHSKDNIKKAYKNLDKLDEEACGYAIELLDSSLNSDHKKIISPLLMTLFISDAPEAPELNSAGFQEVLKSNIQYKSGYPIDILSCIAASYVISKGSIQGYDKDIQVLKTVDSEFIQETINWLFFSKESAHG